MSRTPRPMHEKAYRKELTHYGLFLLVCIVLYSLISLHFQNRYIVLSQDKKTEELRSRELYGLLLHSELKINSLLSMERISALADSMGLSFREPFYKVYQASERGGE